MGGETAIRILISGANGFIGRRLCQRLQDSGHELHRFDHRSMTHYQPHLPNQYYGDIQNYEDCRLTVERSKPETVIHLAAISTTDQYMYDHPQEYISTHVTGTVNMALAFALTRYAGKNKFIHASSSEVYGRQIGNVHSTEDLRPNPENVYSLSKYAAEIYLTGYWGKAFHIPYTIMRPFNTYSNLQYQRTLIDRTTLEMLQGQKKILLGNPNTIRDWLFREDHIEAYMKALENPNAVNQIFNFATGKPYTIRETVNEIAEATGWHGEIRWSQQPPRPHDIQYLCGNSDKAKSLLNWKPEYDLKSGLERYVTELRNKLAKH